MAGRSSGWYVPSEMLRWQSAALILCAGLPALASENPFRGNLFFDTRISSDTRNIQTGARIGDEETVSNFRVAGFLDAEFRPLPSGTRVHLLESWNWYVKDAPYSLGPGVAAFYPLTPRIIVTAATGMGYAFGRDTDVNPDPGWGGWLDLGLRFPLGESSFWGVGYQYHPLPGSTDHRLVFQFRLRAV